MIKTGLRHPLESLADGIKIFNELLCPHQLSKKKKIINQTEDIRHAQLIHHHKSFHMCLVYDLQKLFMNLHNQHFEEVIIQERVMNTSGAIQE